MDEAIETIDVTEDKGSFSVTEYDLQAVPD